MLFIWFTALFILSSCSKEVSTEPVVINPDIDVCEICNMSITSVAYATEAILKDGTVEKFDDIGCMIDFLNETVETPLQMYVKDHLEDEWIKAEDAIYLMSEEYWTPMMYNVVSLKNEANSDRFQKEQGEGQLMTFEEVQQYFSTQGGHQH